MKTPFQWTAKSAGACGFGWLRFVESCVILAMLPFSLWQQREVIALSILVSFFVSVAASVAGYYVCKWLDRHGKGK